ANVSDPEGATRRTAGLVGDRAHGGLTPNPDGSFTYIPDGTCCGTDTFTYTLSDGCPEDDVTGTVTITLTNNPPVANADSYTTSHKATLNVDAASGVLANDADPSGLTPLTDPLFGLPPHRPLTPNPH